MIQHEITCVDYFFPSMLELLDQAPTELTYFVVFLGFHTLLVRILHSLPRYTTHKLSVQDDQVSVLSCESARRSREAACLGFSSRISTFEPRRYTLVLLDENLKNNSLLLHSLLREHPSRIERLVLVFVCYDGLDSPYATYYKSLALGLRGELGKRVSFVRIERECAAMNQQDLAHELRHALEADWQGETVLDQNSMAKPTVGWLHHFFTVVVFISLCVFASPWIAVMDPVTLKPINMDPRVKKIAEMTNWPVKMGAVHACLYMLEFFRDKHLFQRHFGQRITSLYYQLFQPSRFGQHLQMQLETLLQIADAIRSGNFTKSVLAQSILWSIAMIMVIQSALTSYGWHSFEEQLLGFILVSVKLLMFDFTARGAMINKTIGKSLAEGIQWIGGGVSLACGVAFNGFELLHPTAMATLVVVGGALTLSFLLRVRR